MSPKIFTKKKYQYSTNQLLCTLFSNTKNLFNKKAVVNAVKNANTIEIVKLENVLYKTLLKIFTKALTPPTNKNLKNCFEIIYFVAITKNCFPKNFQANLSLKYIFKNTNGGCFPSDIE